MDCKELANVFRRLEGFGFEFKSKGNKANNRNFYSVSWQCFNVWFRLTVEGDSLKRKTYRECIDGIIKVINYLDGQRLASQEKLEIETIKNGKLRRKISKYPEEIKDEISVAVLQQRKAHTKRMEAMNEKLQSAEKNVEYLREECETLKAGNEVLEEAIKKASAEQAQLEETLDSKKDDTLRAIRKLTEAETQLQVTQPKLEQLQQKVHNLQRTLAKCDLKNARQNDPNMLLEKKLEDIKCAVMRKELAIKKHYESIAKLATTQTNISNELAEFDQLVHVCSLRTDTIKEEYGRFVDLLTNEKTDFPVLEDRQQQLRDEITALEEEQKQVEERLTASLKQIEIKITREKKKGAYLKNSRTKLRKELDSNEKQLWELTEKKEKLRTTIEDMKKETDVKTREAEEMNQEIQKVDITTGKEVKTLKKDIRDFREKVKRKQKLMDQEKQLSLNIKQVRGKQSVELKELIETSHKSQMDIAMDTAVAKDKLTTISRQVSDLSLQSSVIEKEGDTLKAEIQNLTMQCQKIEEDGEKAYEALQRKKDGVQEQLDQQDSEKCRWQPCIEDTDFEAQSKSFVIAKLQRTVTEMENKQQYLQESKKQMLDMLQTLDEAKETLKGLVEDADNQHYLQMKANHTETLNLWKEILGVKGQLQVVKQENEKMEQLNQQLRQGCQNMCSQFISLSKRSTDILTENDKLTKQFKEDWHKLQEYHEGCCQNEEKYMDILQQMGSEAVKTSNVLKTTQTALKAGIDNLSHLMDISTKNIPRDDLEVAA